MADFNDSKKFGTVTVNGQPATGNAVKVYPVNANDVTSIFRRVEPIISPDQMISKYLKTVDLSEYNKNELNDFINDAINEVEVITKLPLVPMQMKERIPFDRQLYKAFVFMKVSEGPVMSVEEILIESSNGEAIYKLPATWIDGGFFKNRQINLVPILSIFGAAGLKDGQASNSGLIFIQAVNNFQWLPAFYSVKYTVGVCRKEGHLPSALNQIVGITAALEILSNKSSQNHHTSTSVSQDGISQSATTPGPQLYKQRMDDLKEKRKQLMNHIKAKFGQKYYMSNI